MSASWASTLLVVEAASSCRWMSSLLPAPLQLLLLVLHLLDLLVEAGDLGLGGLGAGQRQPGEVLAALLESLLGLRVELVGALLQLRLLQLQPLLGGEHVGHVAADLL